MQWSDLNQLDSLILETAALGASIEQIGVSGEGRSLYGVTVGEEQAKYTVVILAGCHATEIVGSLAAVAILQSIVQTPIPSVRFGFVPIADPDCLYPNAATVSSTFTLQDALNLSHERDLEGNFMADTYPECVAIRQWFQKFSQIDAYFSLHAAAPIAPGLFFYVGEPSDPPLVQRVIEDMTAIVPPEIPLLDHDPTGVAQSVLAPGFFELALSKAEPGHVSPGSSLAFVADRFQPKFLAVSEIPFAVCPALMNASLDEIHQVNTEVKHAGSTNQTLYEINLETQLHLLQSLVRSTVTQLMNS
ncbi:M14 family zinc carboxypeptidase [Egbenema bharatensis]|uniref:M14 family zinc carboxypeptidase n=1 Tax=Egbenema bharatensis TaxID=3463334 RepID=UPI003A865C3F